MGSVLPALLASAILPGCRPPLQDETLGQVQFALPAVRHAPLEGDAASARIVRQEPRGPSSSLSWELDPRPGAPTAAEALLESGLGHARALGTAQVAGHEAVRLESEQGAALLWRCEKTHRLFSLTAAGPRAPSLSALAERISCHGGRGAIRGEVPSVAAAALGGEWRFGHRGDASISWLRDDAVLTLFAARPAGAPRDAAAALVLAPGWAAAAGLTAAVLQPAEALRGPLGHPALRVRGTARLDGRPVRFALLFWTCLQRQRAQVAIVFSQPGPKGPPQGVGEGPEDFTGADSALLAARCHG